MTFRSLFSARAVAALAFALTLPACSSHPCADTEEEKLIQGHFDYAFLDGTPTSVGFAPGGPLASASLTDGVFVNWMAPLAATPGKDARLVFSADLPDTDGSFDLEPLSAQVCACRTGSPTRVGADTMCESGVTMSAPAECQPVTGHLELRHMNLGVCGSRGGCRNTAAFELILTSPAEKGLSGNFSFLDTEQSIPRSCPDPFFNVG